MELDKGRGYIGGVIVKDWREELQRREAPAVKKPKDPDLCSCMTNMKGKWIQGVYTCVRCQKPVYDAFGKRWAPEQSEAFLLYYHQVTGGIFRE
jgi:hypothetical protein